MEDNFEDFYQCCKSGNIEEVKKYISIGENVNKKREIYGTTLLFASLSESHLEIAELLLKNGANPNSVYLQLSILSEVETLIFEIESGMVNDLDEPDVRETELLIKYGIDLNSIDDWGETPLDVALRKRHQKAEKLLISLGAKTSEELNSSTSSFSNGY